MLPEFLTIDGKSYEIVLGIPRADDGRALACKVLKDAGRFVVNRTLSPDGKHVAIAAAVKKLGACRMVGTVR